MAHRSFVESSGRRWNVWEVLPYSSDRRQRRRRLEIEGLDGERTGLDPRSGEDRRVDSSRSDAPDRRSGSDRRQQSRRVVLDRRSGVERRTASRVRAPVLPGGFSAGWLVFESQGEKRRLTPVPEHWEREGDDALVGWLGRAVTAQHRHAGTSRTSSAGG